jgi:hypothetical protein
MVQQMVNPNIQWYATNCYMQESETGSTPKPIQLFRQGYNGSDPKHPDALCSHLAENRLVSCS